MAEDSTRSGRSIEGRVVKAANDTTRVVAVDRHTSHRLYGRGGKRTAKYVAHDARNESALGDLVRIRECRPLSRTKRWRLETVLERGAS